MKVGKLSVCEAPAMLAGVVIELDVIFKALEGGGSDGLQNSSPEAEKYAGV